MTLPFERTLATLDVRLFLWELTDPRLTPRMPRALRGKAASLLMHFPTNADFERAHHALPDCFGPVPPFRTRAEHATELAVELAPTFKPLAELDDRVAAGNGRDMSDDQPSSRRKEKNRQMATELFSNWVFRTGWLSKHGYGYAVSAELDRLDLWYWSSEYKEVQKEFRHACRRTFLRRFFPWLAPAQAHQGITPTCLSDTMTLPAERTRAIIKTKQFLERLLDPRQIPDVPESIVRQPVGCCATILESATLNSRTVCCRTGSVLREKWRTDMKPFTTPDEAERAFMTARYDVSNEQLADRTTAAPDMGGSLLVGLNAFMEQKITANSLQAWRQMGDIHLQDAQQPGLSGRSRTDAAFDACYMYARCIVGEKSELYTHPDRSIFVLAATELGWDDRVLRSARKHVHARDNPLREASQLEVLMVLALRLKRALASDDVPAEGAP